MSVVVPSLWAATFSCPSPGAPFLTPMTSTETSGARPSLPKGAPGRALALPAFS